MTLKNKQRLVAIVGRPNVGKSTLFNKIVKKRRNLVFDEPGVTRDRIFAKASYEGVYFYLCDTGGFEPSSRDNIKIQLVEQAELAIQEADLIFFVTDGREGLHPIDAELVKRLRKANKTFFVVVNKCDLPRDDILAEEFRKLGVDHIFPVSAEHSRGIGELLETAIEPLSQLPRVAPVNEDHIKLALIGRPNVGKSSLLNRMAGEMRSIVDPRPGTTRDTIDSEITYFGKTFVILDTAGIRKKSKMADQMERYSALRSVTSLEESDVAILVIDAKDGPTEGDQRVAGYAYELRKPILILVNKWDLIEDKTSKSAKEYEEVLRRELRYIPYAPIIFSSALENQRVSRIIPKCLELFEQGNKRNSTSTVNKVLQKTLLVHTPPLTKGRAKRIKFFYGTQITVSPPRFVIFSNAPQDIHFSYRRFMENQFRKELGYENIPISVFFRERSKNPLEANQKGKALAEKHGLSKKLPGFEFDQDIRDIDFFDEKFDFGSIPVTDTEVIFDDEDDAD